MPAPLLLALAFVTAVTAVVTANTNTTEGIVDFAVFEHHFRKVYKSDAERNRRRRTFHENAAKARFHNAGNHTWRQSVNHFSDLSPQEWRALIFGKGGARLRTRPAEPGTNFKDERLLQSLPPSVDWRGAGAVTPIKDQGSCGSCWAFATVGAIEGAVAVATGQLTSLSEQQIVSCEVLSGDGNNGCSGGDAGFSMFWVARHAGGGLCTEAAWPYTSGATGQNGPCATNCTRPWAGRVLAPHWITSYSESALMAAIFKQPLVVSVGASSDAWQQYGGGVLNSTECACSNCACIDHQVTAVGYGTDPVGGDYWLLKNQWGTWWGEAGYIRVSRSSAWGPEGQCGVLCEAVLAIVPTPTWTLSQSPTATATASVSRSLTRSPSPTQTRTRSASPSQSNSRSQVVTPSRTQSTSRTGTPSESVTLTGTSSQTTTRTNSGSPSRTQTITRSGTPSVTSSLTGTSSLSHSQVSSRSQTLSYGASPSPTPTQEFTLTQTLSQSGSRSSSFTPSQSPTQGRTASATPSQTTSLTPSLSTTRSQSTSQRASPTATQTPSLTDSQPCTPSTTSSQTSSPSESITQAATPTQTPSQSTSQDATPSQTQTSTRSSSLSQTRTPGRMSCFNGVLDGGETDVDCGGSCSPCVPGRTCRATADCDARLGTALGSALLPGAPGVACNPIAGRCGDVRASPDAWSAAVPPPPFVSLSLVVGTRPAAFTAAVFRNLQSNVAAALAQGRPALDIVPENVLVASIVAGIDVNASSLSLLLLLPMGMSATTAAASVALNGTTVADAVRSALTPSSAAGTSTTSASLLASEPVSLLPQFPLSVAVSGSLGDGAREGSLAPAAAGTIAAIVIFALVLAAFAVRRLHQQRRRKATLATSHAPEGAVTNPTDVVQAYGNPIPFNQRQASVRLINLEEGCQREFSPAVHPVGGTLDAAGSNDGTAQAAGQRLKSYASFRKPLSS